MKSHLVRRSIIISLLTVSVFSNISFAKEVKIDSYVENLTQSLKFDTTNINTKNIIDKYCSSVLENTLKYDDLSSYKASESAFVYIVCTNINKKYIDEFDEIKKYFSGSSFKELWITEYGTNSNSNKNTDYCSPSKSDMNKCNIPKQFSKIFQTIINEYTNIKQSSIYGITKKIEDGKDIENFANKFWQNHFFTEICNSKKTWIAYTKSCNITKSYIEASSKLLDNLKFINKDEIYKEKNNLIYNWIIRHSDTIFIDFTDTLYNELLFFRLFIDYYSLIISKNYNIISNDSSQVTKQITKLNNEFMWIEKSISMTTRSLRDLYVSFPIHVWLVMYYEDVLKLGKELKLISNPIYNLYDKFRNVQKPSK